LITILENSGGFMLIHSPTFCGLIDTRRRTGFDRSCMEDISPRRKSASPPEQALPHGRERVSHQERKLSSGVNGHQTEGAPRGSWRGPPEPSLTPEAPKLDMASSPKVLQKSEVREKLEAVRTPNADVVDLPGKDSMCQLFLTFKFCVL
jgi:hypothetical protein